jgi:hypothetical protein
VPAPPRIDEHARFKWCGSGDVDPTGKISMHFVFHVKESVFEGTSSWTSLWCCKFERGSDMTLPINQAEESTDSSVRRAASNIQFAQREAVTNRKFEHAYCGVLIALIFIIIFVLVVLS